MAKMANLIDQMAQGEGFTETKLEGVRLFKALRYMPRTPLIYKPGICIVAQGKKIGYLDNYQFQYDANTYLVVSVTMPFECETFSSPEEPLLGLYIDIDLKQLHELMSSLAHSAFCLKENPCLPKAIGPAKINRKFNDAVVRLLETLQNETETKIFGKNLVKEIMFRTMQGDQSPMLHALANLNGSFSRINRALAVIHKNYSQKFNVENLAEQVNMSVSAFHRAFKQITSESPVQYLKKFRLNLAKELMVQNDLKAYMAASQVGYDSVSQFSREFKRYFGKTPATLVKETRQQKSAQ